MRSFLFCYILYKLYPYYKHMRSCSSFIIIIALRISKKSWLNYEVITNNEIEEYNKIKERKRWQLMETHQLNAEQHEYSASNWQSNEWKWNNTLIICSIIILMTSDWWRWLWIDEKAEIHSLKAASSSSSSSYSSITATVRFTFFFFFYFSPAPFIHRKNQLSTKCASLVVSFRKMFKI